MKVYVSGKMRDLCDHILHAETFLLEHLVTDLPVQFWDSLHLRTCQANDTFIWSSQSHIFPERLLVGYLRGLCLTATSTSYIWTEHFKECEVTVLHFYLLMGWKTFVWTHPVPGVEIPLIYPLIFVSKFHLIELAKH